MALHPKPWHQPPSPLFIYFKNSRLGILNHYFGFFSLNAEMIPVAVGQLLMACPCRALGGSALERRQHGGGL